MRLHDRAERSDTSLLEMSEGSCDAPADMDKCTPTFKGWYHEKCTRQSGWQYSSMRANGLRCEFSKEEPAETPLKCNEMFANEKKLARYFEFDISTKRITCKLQVEKCGKSLDGILQNLGDAKAEGISLQKIGFWRLGD